MDPQLNQSLSHMSDLSIERVFGAAKRLLADTDPQAAKAEAEADA